MKKVFRLALPLLAVISITGTAWADDAGLRRCRAVTNSAARLACYDALPLGAAASPSASVPKPAAAAPAPVAKAAPAVPPPAERFGLEYKASPGDQLGTIETHIPGRFEGWKPDMRIQLANGQVWQVIDNTSRYVVLDNPRVVVRRGVMGAFFLDIEGDNRSPRVRRIQ